MLDKKWWFAGMGVWVLSSLMSGIMHTNPPISHKVNWDSPKTQELFSRVCMDCHSHETKWPWYSYVAPMSFVINHHVEEGREHFNVSAGILDEAHEAAEKYEEGEMPESGYLIFHREAELNPEERAELIAGLNATFNSNHEHEHEQTGDHHHSGGHHKH